MKKTLSERIDRLAKFKELKAPPSILCASTMLVFKGMFAVYPKEMSEVFGSWIHDVSKSEAAICPKCGGYMNHEIHLCRECLSENEDLEDKKDG